MTLSQIKPGEFFTISDHTKLKTVWCNSAKEMVLCIDMFTGELQIYRDTEMVNRAAAHFSEEPA